MMAKCKGMSLIEIGVIVLVISLALVPIVRMIGGNSGGSGISQHNTVTSANNVRSHVMVAANSLVERALSGDSSLGLNLSSVPLGGVRLFPTTGRFSYTTMMNGQGYNEDIYYTWVVRDVSYQTDANGNLIRDPNNNPIQVSPVGNRIYQATLKVYTDNNTNSTPMFVLPTYLYSTTTQAQTQQGKTGIVIVLDTSGSMKNAMHDEFRWGSPMADARYRDIIGTTGEGNTPYDQNGNELPIASPWLAYRYDTTMPAPYRLNLFDDSQLDIAIQQHTDPFNNNTDVNPQTPYWENYIGRGVRGMGDCTSDNVGVTAQWAHAFTPANEANGNLNINSVTGVSNVGTWDADPGLRNLFLNWARYGAYNGNHKNDKRHPPYKNPTTGAYMIVKNSDYIRQLCLASTQDQAAYDKAMNMAFSRIEAARSSLLAFLVSIERNIMLSNTIRFGLVTFSGSSTVQVGNSTLEDPKTIDADPEKAVFKRYENMRTRMSWINRAYRGTDGSIRDRRPANAIYGDGGTNTYSGISAAADMLLRDNTLQQRIIVFATDGYPNPNTGNNSDDGLVTYAESIGKRATSKPITMYTIAMLDGNPYLMRDNSAACKTSPRTCTVNPNGIGALANATPSGKSYFASSVADMKQIFDQVALQIQFDIMNANYKRYQVPSN